MHKAEVALAELLARLEELGNKYVAAMTEPYTYKDRLVCRPRNAKCFPSFVLCDRPRAGLFVSEGLCPVELIELEDRDTAVAMFRFGANNIVVASVYLDIHNKAVVSKGLKKVVSFCKKRGFQCVIAADTNCHSAMFGPSTNKRGEVLEDFVVQEGLAIQNVGMEPTFETTRASSCIDATMTLGPVSLETGRLSKTSTDLTTRR